MPVSRLWLKYREWRQLLGRQYVRAERFFEGKSSEETHSEQALRRHKRIAHYVYNVVFALLVSLILVQSGPRTSRLPDLAIGEIAEKDIFSPLSADLEPKGALQTTKEESVKAVPPIFDYDDSAIET